MSQIVSVKIQINDGGTFKDVTINADDLARAINTVKDRADDLDKSLVSMASLGQIFDGLSSAVQNLSGYISNLTSDYKSALEVETKLSTAMRNTMDATDEEVQSIKDFCDEQERLGVVAGDVQISAAQELATYLEFSDSLKTLIPVVNDMTVQQYGLGASAESATQIATMLGKVMNGQTKALSRYGYEFTEAQEAVLLYGNEAERAAMLAEVVGQSVGGMNYEMAKTPVGIMQQAENRLGKMRENIGAFAIQMEPALKNLSLFTSTTADIVKVVQAIDAVKRSAIGMKAASLAAAVAQKAQAAAARILGVSEYTAVTATRTLKIEMAALEATVTLGVSVAVAGLVTLIGKLVNKGRQAETTIEGIDDATEEYGRVAGDARGQIMLEIGALEDIIEKHKKEKDKVIELNEKYGESFGYHKTAAEWYDTLTTKSEAYCRQLGYEAKAKLLSSQYGEALVTLDEARKAEREFQGEKAEKRLTIFRDVNGKAAGWGFDDKPTKEYRPFLQAVQDAENNVSNLKKQLDDCVVAGKAAAEEMESISGSGGRGGSGGDGGKLEGLAKDLEDYRKSVQAAVQTNAVFNAGWDETGVKLKAMESGLTSLIGKYGTENITVQKLIGEYRELVGARMAMDKPLDALDPSKLTAGAKAVTDIGSKIKEPTKSVQEFVQEIDKVGAAQDVLSSLGNSMSSFADIVGEGAAAWLEWGANLLSAISQAIPQIAALTAAKKAEATANTAAMVTGVGASMAFLGPVKAVASIASVLAAIANLPKFASGGIAYGPTIGMFGEYAGANHDPEVVAPLSKLTQLLPAGFGGGEVVFHISGSNLEGVLERRRRLVRRGR